MYNSNAIILRFSSRKILFE